MIILPANVAALFLGEAVDYEELTVDNVVRTLNAAKLAASHYVWFQMAGGPIRWTVHGLADPTTSFGIQVFDLEQSEGMSKTATKWRFIREGASNGVVRAVYYR